MIASAERYRIEVESGGKLVIASTTDSTRYTPPPRWIATRVQGTALWRITALDASGQNLAQSVARRFALKD